MDSLDGHATSQDNENSSDIVGEGVEGSTKGHILDQGGSGIISTGAMVAGANMLESTNPENSSNGSLAVSPTIRDAGLLAFDVGSSQK